MNPKYKLCLIGVYGALICELLLFIEAYLFESAWMIIPVALFLLLARAQFEATTR